MRKLTPRRPVPSWRESAKLNSVDSGLSPHRYSPSLRTCIPGRKVGRSDSEEDRLMTEFLKPVNMDDVDLSPLLTKSRRLPRSLQREIPIAVWMNQLAGRAHQPADAVPTCPEVWFRE